MGDRSASIGWLGWTGAEDPDCSASKLRSFRRLLLLTLACEAWLALRYIPYSSRPGVYGLVATAFVACAIAGWGDRWSRPALSAAFLLLLGVVFSVFPDNANHQFLALLLAMILLLVDPDGEEGPRNTETALQSMRWIAIIGFAWAGVMKLHYGYWLGGEFLGFRIAGDAGFARSLGLLVPEVELARLAGLGTDVGAGPFRPEAPLLVALSSLTWIAELLLPLGLLWRRTRGAAMITSIVFIVAIEVAAREIFFGGLMIGLLLLFARRDRVAPATPWIATVYIGWLLTPDLLAWLARGPNP
jgi:hypothetical protein